MTGLFAGAERKAKRERLGDSLQLLDRYVDLLALAETVDARLLRGDRSRGGQPLYP